MTRPLAFALALLLTSPAVAQVKNGDELFRQLEDELPTPTPERAASGAPGHAYWQQRVDYSIDVTLHEAEHRISGKETITYTNNSPDTLRYLWVQLDQNTEGKAAESLHLRTTEPLGDEAKLPYGRLGYEVMRQGFDGGHRIASVTDAEGKPLRHTVVGTMMRVDLPAPLAPKSKTVFSVAWSYLIRNISVHSTRTGYEFIKGDEANAIYTIAHWYPRLAAYSDRYGWHVHHYLGEEFALEFGDFDVRITAPADVVVGATGELQNPQAVLTPEQQQRLAAARTASKPVVILSAEEAKLAEAGRAKGTKTWAFRAENVRDYAWAASRKYIWDAMGVKVGERTVMAMSYYPNEANPLWEQYSTHAVAHTLEYYSKHAVPYPYPVALSCNGAVGGMEHPMISFQRARPEPDGTYSPRTKHGLISVIIHEVGHNWFPMIINNPERRWRWMDEGLNSFVQQIAEGYWSRDYPSRNDARRKRILDYMRSSTDQPIMTNTSLILQGGNNAYSKVALALTVLRESVLGRDVFDFAFGEYCRRWAFKRPVPADFFRSMEDAAGVDLDWYFRGWFYGTDHVDQAITGLRRFELARRDPKLDKPAAKARKEAQVRRPRQRLNDAQPKRVERHPGLKDFYDTDYDEYEVTVADVEEYTKLLKKLEPHERELLDLKQLVYVADFQNVGGLAMPLPLEFHYADGTTSTLRVPATVWRRSVGGTISKLFLSAKPIVRIVLDPQDELADVDLRNNAFPQRIAEGTLTLTKDDKKPNPMQKRKKAAEKAAKKAQKTLEDARKKAAEKAGD